jgi:hypothetical protein
LRARCERPRRRTADQRNELAPPHEPSQSPKATTYHIKEKLCASQQNYTADVRFGSKADIEAASPDVRYSPKSGHC